jgi:hypothetical protein
MISISPVKFGRIIHPTRIRDIGTGARGAAGLDAARAYRVLAALDEKKMRANTLIVFVYDIAPMRAGIRQGDWKLVCGTMLPSTNRALRRQRRSVREEQRRRAAAFTRASE